MKILLTGLNHKTAPVELRERLAIPEGSLGQSIRQLLALEGVREAVVLSTCNRVEILVACDQEPRIASFLAAHFGVNDGQLAPHLYQHENAEAARHLFRVAASLDSMVVGEPQILGQVKQACTVARSENGLGSHLERLTQAAIITAKRVRTETSIGASSVSIASVAVDLARRIFGSLEGKKVMLVGAGKMSELAARHLVQHGAKSVLVANRTFESAVRLARQFQGHPIPFDDLHARASEADILITSTGSPEPLIRVPHAQQYLHRRRNRPIFLIDIAVPRDVDPELNRLEGVFLYDIDDLQSVASSNLTDRGREAEHAETIVAEEVARYSLRKRELDAAPVLVDLQHAAEDLRLAELARNRGRLRSLTVDQQEAVEALTRGLMNKFLHGPLQAVKAAVRAGNLDALEAISAAFGVTERMPQTSASPGPPASDSLADAEADPNAMETAGAVRKARR